MGREFQPGPASSGTSTIRANFGGTFETLAYVRRRDEPEHPLGARAASQQADRPVGVSAGSMVMTPRIGEYFVEWPSAPDDRTLGVVDFSIFPHLNAFPTNTLAHAERWAADLGGPAYAIDEQTAIKVVDGSVVVVSEGEWTKFG
ncbi:Type 1 glutamine amidotransferase-like domain-containing protein [Arthrobacter sp. MW3 TE3886]|uniref:Type 1 glutamine amidotransferase-like domain-containing protein n=1 Tax=Arthrobacter sp. MW3 TE3886 TaxID=3156254 RepID=UPI0035140C03